jgi:hypothetical protein
MKATRRVYLRVVFPANKNVSTQMNIAPAAQRRCQQWSTELSVRRIARGTRKASFHRPDPPIDLNTGSGV